MRRSSPENEYTILQAECPQKVHRDGASIDTTNGLDMVSDLATFFCSTT
jgi:hypothetical protein